MVLFAGFFPGVSLRFRSYFSWKFIALTHNTCNTLDTQSQTHYYFALRRLREGWFAGAFTAVVAGGWVTAGSNVSVCC